MVFKNTSVKHSHEVAAWVVLATKDLSSEKMIDLYERAFDSVWARARSTLGAITLTAIGERAIAVCSESEPLLDGVKVVNENRFSFDQLRKQDVKLEKDKINRSLQLLLTEFISIIGSLTSELLSPAIHEDLKKVTLSSNLKILRTNGDLS